VLVIPTAGMGENPLTFSPWRSQMACSAAEVSSTGSGMCTEIGSFGAVLRSGTVSAEGRRLLKG
jgi:hypothetical protein